MECIITQMHRQPGDSHLPSTMPTMVACNLLHPRRQADTIVIDPLTILECTRFLTRPSVQATEMVCTPWDHPMIRHLGSLVLRLRK